MLPGVETLQKKFYEQISIIGTIDYLNLPASNVQFIRMWKNLTLRIESELATKLTVITIAFVGCFGLVTNLMRSKMPISNDLRNVSAPGSLRHLPGQNDNYTSKSLLSSDLDSNASYLYAVVVSPDYIDPYNVPESNNEYDYGNYEYDASPIFILRKQRRRYNPNRVIFRNKYYRRRHRNTFRNRLRSNYGLFRRRSSMRNRRIYISGRRHNQFRTKIPRISTRRHADRFLRNRRRYLPSNTHHGYRSAKTVPQHGIANRRHQNYQNSIVTGSKSSAIGVPFLGIFGLLQILGIIFNVGLGK